MKATKKTKKKLASALTFRYSGFLKNYNDSTYET